jgi:choline dehydrogenase-like flavoprotein
MTQPEHYDEVVLGSGAGGNLLSWHLAGSGRWTALGERRWIGGSCPNIAWILPPGGRRDMSQDKDTIRFDPGRRIGGFVLPMLPLITLWTPRARSPWMR